MATDHSQPNALYILAATVISVLVVINIIVALQAWFQYERDRVFERHVVQQPFIEYNDVSSRQKALLNSYAIDTDLEQYSIPIEEAMAIIVRETNVREDASN